MGKREEMRKAIEDSKVRKTKLPSVAAAARKGQAAPAEEKKPRKFNWRSAKSREARAKERGRLPHGTEFIAKWDATAGRFSGSMILFSYANLVELRRFDHSADGLFRLMEELDVMFWHWMASDKDVGVKAELIFPAVDHKPETLPPEVISCPK